MNNNDLTDKLYKDNYLNKKELLSLISTIDEIETNYLFEKSMLLRYKYYGHKVYLRGLIEISNYCKQGCKYCGINRHNKFINRYRLSPDEIIEICKDGYELGYRTFVLQGGEDDFYTDEIIINLIKDIKKLYSDVAITLSLGEKNYNSYEKFFNAGADRYLLRHETCNEDLYDKIHEDIKFKDRKNSLYNLKDIGYQVGAGFMVGIPGEKLEDLVDNILFLKELNPAMVGIGPFIPHDKTIYKNEVAGRLDMSLLVLALVRLFLPDVLLPATTALNSIDIKGRDRGLSIGCNVVMPNLSPMENRVKYSLYENKAYSGNESASELKKINEEIKKIGLVTDMSKGDNINWRYK